MRNHWKVGSVLLALFLLAALMLWNEPAIAAKETERGRGGSVWGANYFPNISLTTHDGRSVRFFDDLIADRVVALNFIYTTCPDACPMETARMMDVHRLLGDRVGKDIFFYSITIDPEKDTPEVLRRYVETWGIGEGWTFLTGKEEDILLLRKKLGVYNARDPGKNAQDHNLSLVIGNQSTGRWMKRSPYENPYVLATQLGSWLHNWKLPGMAERDYSDAPQIRQISTGENLFRTRCASCHTIGQGDVVELAERRVGPDLYNIGQQRDLQWLRRWLAEPDKMLEEKDPLAMALLAQYKNIPMPNLRLTETDVTKLLGYMDEESRRITNLRARNAAPAGHDDHSHHAHHGAH
jgi:protein SCO1/2